MARPLARLPVSRVAWRGVALVAVCLLALLLGRSDAYAAAFSSTGTGDWTVSLGGTPGVGDTVTIQSGHTVTLTTAVSVDGVTVNSGGTLIVSGAGSLTVGASNLVVAGTLTNGGTVVDAGTLTVTGTLTNNSSLSVTGIATVTSPGTVANNSSASITGQLTGNGSLVQGTGATLNLLSAAVPAANITTLTANTNVPNTVSYNGGAQTIGVYNYWNLTLSGSGAKAGNPTSVGGALTLAGTATYTLPALTIGGDLNVQGGTLTVPAVVVTVTGNTSVSGGGVLTINAGAGAKTFTGDVTINGGTWQNLGNVAATINGNITYVSGTFTSGTGVYTMNGVAKQITGPLNISAVTVGLAGSVTTTGSVAIGALTVTGTVFNAATLTISESLGVAAALAGTGTLTNGPGATLNLETTAAPAITNLNLIANTTNTVNYSRAGAQTFKATTYNHVVLSNSGAKTGAAITVNGTFTMQDAVTFTTSASAITFTGSFINNSSAVTPITATAANVVTFDTPSPVAATSIGGSSNSTMTFLTVNFNNIAGVSTSKTLVATTATVGGGAAFSNAGTLTATTLTVSGAATMTNSGTLTATTLNVNSSGALTNAGTGGVTVVTTLNIASAGAYTNNGTTTMTGTLVGAGQFTNGVNATLNLNNAAAPTVNTLDTSTNVPNTVTYGGAAQGVRAGVYSHLTFANSGIKTAAGSITVNGDFTLTGTAAFTTGAFAHVFAGNWVHNSTVATPLVATGSSITFTTPATPAATALSGTGTNTLAFIDLAFTNASGMTVSKVITATGAVAVSGNLTIGSSASLTVSGAGTITVSNGANLANAGTLTLSGTGDITVGVASTSTLITNTGTVTAGGLIDGVGTFVNAANGILNINGAAAPTIATLDLAANPNTVNYGLAGAQTIRGGTYHHLTLSTSGTKTAGSGLTVNGTLTLSGTVAFNMLASTHTFNGNWVNGATTSVIPSGLVQFSGASATISGAGSLALSSMTVTNGASLTSLINLTATGAITVESGATLTLDPSVVVSGVGTFTAASGSSLVLRSALGIAAAGASGAVQTTGRSFSTGANYAYANITGTPQLTGTGLPATVNNLTVDNANGVTLTSSVAVTSALTLSAGAGQSLSIGANTLTLNGTLSIGAGATLTGGATSSVAVGGAGANLTLPALTLLNLTVDRANGVTLSGDATLGGALTLTSGVLTTGANKVAVSSAGSTTRTSGYVTGRLEKGIANGTPVTVTYEVGDGAYTPVTIVFADVSNPGTVEVRSVAGDHADIAASAVVAATSVNRNWLVTLAGVVFTTYNVTFTFVPGDLDAGVNSSNFIVAKRDGGWTAPAVGTRTATTTQATGLAAIGAPSAFQVGEPAPAPPSNTVLPAISGTATEGELLTSTTGTWDGAPTSFAYQWRRCDAGGAACVDIGGATASTYTLVLADVGGTVRSQVTATSTAGSGQATSAQTAVIAPQPPPSNSVLPSISGTTTQGELLTAANGTWAGTPSFTYQWRRCDAAGAACGDIGGATAGTYTLVLLDVGGTIRVVVTGTNGAGNASATSVQTAVIAPEPAPSNSVLPVISGTTTSGQTLSTSTGTWLGSPTFTYQWRRCDAGGASCADAGGATASTYVLTDADVESTIRVAVTGTNGTGSATATSAQTAAIAAAGGGGGGGNGGGGGAAQVVGPSIGEPGVGNVGTVGATTTSISASGPSSLIVSSEGFQLQVIAPGGTLPGGGTLFAGVVAAPDELLAKAPLPATADLIVGYVIQATTASGEAAPGDFSPPAVIEVRLDPSVVPTGALPQDLVIAFWDGTAWVETPTTVTVNADGSVLLHAEVTHFTLFGAVRRTVPLPAAPGAAVPPPASTGAGFAAPPIFAVSGQASAVFLGRTVGDLEAAARTAGATGAWVQDAGGTFGLLVIDGPAFLRNAFVAQFPTGFGAVTAVTLVRPASPPASPGSGPSTPPASTPEATGGEATRYTVTATDTLSGIGTRFDIDWLRLAEVNGIAGPNYFVRPGQVLTIPARGAAATPASTPPPASSTPVPATVPGTYTVGAADTLSEIAARFGVSLSRLASANDIAGPAYVVRTGQVLTIPANDGSATYVVTATDTLSGIAAKFDLDWIVLAEANGITGPGYVIRAGQVLKIPAR